MSLHNSTQWENQLDYLERVDWFENTKRSFVPNSNYKSKAQRSGFWFERRKHGATKCLCLHKYGLCEVNFDEGQARKSARGMPWHQEPMKDVISCDKLRGGANILRSGDFRMGKPTARYPTVNKIAAGGEPPELKHLSRARKRHQPRFR